ncbi:MAG: arginine deiminase-related protein [Saprospiraceae bacterium]
MRTPNHFPHSRMVRPANFGYNEQTAENNAFQLYDDSLSDNEIRVKALVEFDAFVECLKNEVCKSSLLKIVPLRLNLECCVSKQLGYISSGGFVITYPMFAPIREGRSESNY